MRRLAIPLLLALALAATGCFDYTEELWLRADGSAQLHLVTESRDIASGLGGDGSLFGADKEFDDGTGKVWTERKDGQVITHVESTIADFRKTKTLAPGDRPLGKLSPDWYTIEPLGFGRYQLVRTVGLPGAEGPAGSAGDSHAPAGGDLFGDMGRGLGNALADQMLEGHEFSVTLHAPLILSSNADEKQGMTTAVWKREMTQIAGTAGQPFTIEATVLLIDYWLAGIAAGVVLLMLIALIATAARRRRKPAQREMPTSVDQPGAGL